MAKNRNEIDLDQLRHIKDHAQQLKAQHAERDKMFEEFEAMYMMRWGEATSNKLAHSKIVLSPDARNALVGAVRLMIATDPTFSVPEDTSDADTKQKSERIEVAAERMWDQAGRIAGEPIHYPAILSAMLYGEMHTAITSTRKLLEAHKRANHDVARAERVAALTPFLLENWNPKNGYPEMDSLGLRAYYRVAKTTPAQMRSVWGEAMPERLLSGNIYRPVNLYLYYDTEWEAIWTDEGDLRCMPHGLPVIPVSVQLTDGSMMFDKPEDQRQPLLYTMLRSRMWNAQNIALTVLFTTVFGMGVSPMFVHKAPTSAAGKTLDFNFDNALGVVELEGDEEFSPLLNRGLIDPSLVQAMGLAERKGTESTIYHQALGEPIDRNTSFSEANLLAQSGRLPLIGTQKRGGWGIARIIETAFMLFRGSEKGYRSNGIELRPSDVPANLQVDVKLEISLPQDRLQLANIANILTQGDNPVTSKRWVRENVLNIGQSDAMTREIWKERAREQMFQQFLGDQMQQLSAPASPAAVAAAGPQSPAGQAGIVQGGLPPAQAGMIPGMGQGVVPPEAKGV